MTAFVTKQTFLEGRACLTRGWYAHHASGDAPGHGMQWRFWVGADVARRVRDWLGDGRELRRTPIEAAAEETRAATDAATDALLYETTFTWNGLVARADALRRAAGAWDLIEIKSGKSKDDEVSEEYLDDIAYTWCVAQGAGLALGRATLILINRDYRLNGTADMFALVDVTDEARSRAATFAAMAPPIVAAAANDTRPEPVLNFACRNCEWFASDCVGKDIPDPLFVLPRLSKPKFEQLKGYERITRLPATAELTENQQRIADVIRSGAPSLDPIALRVLDDVRWPVRYLDFEAVMPHLPWFDETAPYEVLPFQYSVHTIASPGAAPSHAAYLAAHEGDWRRDLAERLLEDLGASGSIVVYSSYEQQRVKALAESFPDLREPLLALLPRLFDLEVVFKKGYCHPGFAGRTSIKKVLPVMVPALSYAGLPVNNGDDALGLFALMRVGAIDDAQVPGLREQLLEYCHLDTLAMLRLHEEVGRVRGA